MNRPPNRPSLLRIKLGFPGPSLNLWSPIACFKQQKTLSWIINIGTAKRSKTAVAHLHHAVRGLETGTPDGSFNLLTKWTGDLIFSTKTLPLKFIFWKRSPKSGEKRLVIFGGENGVSPKWTANSNNKFFAEFLHVRDLLSLYVILLSNIDSQILLDTAISPLLFVFSTSEATSPWAGSRDALRPPSPGVRLRPRTDVLVPRPLILSKPWPWRVTGVERIYIAHQLLDLERICKHNA